MSVRIINKYHRENKGHYVVTWNNIKNTNSTFLKKRRVYRNETEVTDIELLKEKEYLALIHGKGCINIIVKEREQNDEKLAQELNEREYEDTGNLIEW